MSILCVFAVLSKRGPQGHPASPVPARHVDRSAVIEVVSVVVVEDWACVAWEACCFCWTGGLSAHEDAGGDRQASDGGVLSSAAVSD